MGIEVESGAGMAGANSYLSEADFEAYCEDRGLTVPRGDVEPALIRGTAWIEARYGARFPGCAVKGRDQGLSWPRSGAYDRAGRPVPSDVVPVEVMRAACEAALRELAASGSLVPDLTSSGMVRRKKLASMEIEYAVADGQRPAAPSFPLIDGILAPLIGGGFGGSVRLVRA